MWIPSTVAGLMAGLCADRVTGIRPAVSQTLVSLGVDLAKITTLRNLQEGLRACLESDASGPAAASRS